MLTVLKPVLVYDRNMQMHLYANLPHCVTNLHSNFLSGISIFQILYLILASLKGLSSFLLRFEYTTYRNYKEKSGGIISLPIFDLCKVVTFFHWWSRNFLFYKGESGVPRFFISYSVNIRAKLCPSIHFG